MLVTLPSPNLPFHPLPRVNQQSLFQPQMCHRFPHHNLQKKKSKKKDVAKPKRIKTRRVDDFSSMNNFTLTSGGKLLLSFLVFFRIPLAVYFITMEITRKSSKPLDNMGELMVTIGSGLIFFIIVFISGAAVEEGNWRHFFLFMLLMCLCGAVACFGLAFGRYRK